MNAQQYETDFYGWAMDQATKLKTGRLDALDLQHLAEEIESMGKGKRSQLENRLELLLAHLLKWHYQGDKRTRSWSLTISEQRRAIARLMRKNPSLKAVLDDALEDSYEEAIFAAARETGLGPETFPVACPWAIEWVLDTEFWPE